MALLEEFIHEPFVQTIAIDDAIAARYGRVFAELRRAGTPIPINDVWIAASTLHVGGRLLTFDADFSHVRDLDVLLLVP